MTLPDPLAVQRALRLTDRLSAAGIRGIALTWVDNAGVTRVKTIPIDRLEYAVTWGIDMSPVFDVFLIDDSITTSPHIAGPDGDLRMFPDLDRLTELAAQPGWAWAPVDRYTQEREPYAACQRGFARRMVKRAAERGLTLKMGFETEWFCGEDTACGEPVPACTGPAYGMTRVLELSDYLDELYEAFADQGVEVLQIHPEYAPGQLAISTGYDDPVTAADTVVLVRQTIRAVAGHFGLRVSFAPVVVPGQAGNGGHLHLSLWRDGENLCGGGDGPYGMRGEGEAFLAGVLDALPALCVVGAPGVASYLRLIPSHWAGAFQCWGRENREAALRFVTSATSSVGTASAEIKCFDASANPYLVVGAVIAAGLAGLDADLRLPPELTGDPALLSEPDLLARGIRRLPASLPEALEHLERCAFLRDAMGDPLFQAFTAVRRGEIALFDGASPDEITAATRWRY